MVLRHPHELRRKNASLPLVALCLFGSAARAPAADGAAARGDGWGRGEDFAMRVVVGRQFDSAVVDYLRDPNEVVMLVFPHPRATDLEEGLRNAGKRISDGKDSSKGSANSIENDDANDDAHGSEHGADDAQQKKITVVFLDATWKHAREMNAKMEKAGAWPEDLLRVQLTPTAAAAAEGTGGTAGGAAFVERRFGIRAPPSPDHLSTAECVAWVCGRIESEPRLYEGIARTLDCMVAHWQNFATTSGGRSLGGRPEGSTAGGVISREGENSNWDSMSQKKRKIPHDLNRHE